MTEAPAATLRIAARYVRAAFFNVGDIILYGKYKNKKGKIIAFSENEKGQPLVEIEPIPKGRKQNKIMGLFKIWNLSVVEKSQEGKKEAMDPLASRVASRYVLAENVPMGKTWERGDLRIHRFRDHFRITDLTNAGKRNKKVRQMTVAPTYAFKGDHDDWLERMSKNMLDYPSYDGILSFLNDILHDYPGEIRINETQLRGVDVNPGGFEKIEFDVVDRDWSLSVKAELDDFLVVQRDRLRRPTRPDEPANDSGQPMFQDTIYSPKNKAGAKVFYNWLQGNREAAKGMSLQDFKALWRELKIPYDGH